MLDEVALASYSQPMTDRDNVIASLSRPGSVPELFMRMATCTVAIHASDVGFLAIVAPEVVGLHPTNLPFRQPVETRRALRATCYASGDLVPRSSLAVSLGGRR